MSRKNGIPTKVVLCLSAWWAACPAASADDANVGRKASGATVLVPLYSDIYFGEGSKSFALAATVSFRNTDPDKTVVLTRADYHDSGGKLIERLVKEAVEVPPLGSRSLRVKESDRRGGPGGSVVVGWRSGHAVHPPLVESVMIGAASGQGISFTSRGVVISSDGTGQIEK